MALHVTTFGHLQQDSISMELDQIAVHAMMVHTPIPYHPPYVGNDYFCDSGRNNTGASRTYFTNDPLWDGAGCVSGSCCTFNSPPWFCKNLSTPTTDDIQLRLCLNQEISDEDTPLEVVELYVK